MGLAVPIWIKTTLDKLSGIRIGKNESIIDVDR